MDSFEFNKLIGALLGTVFLVLSIAIVSDGIFAAPIPASPGFAIEAVEPEAGDAGGGAAPAEEPIGLLLASADAEAGAAVFKKCTACHTAEKGGANKVGPNLWDIVNRPVASHEGFAYSAAIKEFSEAGAVKWDFDHLNHFLASPKGLIKGTAMSFAGVKKSDERANLILYLHTLSDSPAPLPAATPAPENASAPAEGAAPAAPAEGTAPAAPAEGAAPAAPAEGAAPAPAEGAAPAAPAEGAAPAPAEGDAPPADSAAPPAPPPAEPAPAPAQ